MAKKTLTLEALLQEKKAVKPKKWTYESEELGCTIKLEKIIPSKISAIVKDKQDGNIDDFAVCLMLIYESVPVFRAKELLKKYEVVEPFEVVDRVFDRNLGEIYELGGQIMANYGFSKEEAKDDIKRP